MEEDDEEGFGKGIEVAGGRVSLRGSGGTEGRKKARSGKKEKR
jgi:hypothetical protein